MPFSVLERARIRDHLGYLNTSSAASIQLGFPRASQPLFLVESALNLVLPEAETLVREYADNCDRALADIREARNRLKLRAVDNVKFNPDEMRQRWAEYRTEAEGLADILGVPLNTYSGKWKRVGGGGVNWTVNHEI